METNEYLKEIMDDTKKYMPHGSKGMWTSGTWSEKEVLNDKEVQEWGSWFYTNLLSTDQQNFKTNLFEQNSTLYQRILPDIDTIGSLLIYTGGEPFNIQPNALNQIIRGELRKLSIPTTGMWFVGRQSHAYNYDIMDYGPMTLEDLYTPTRFVNYEGMLGPIFRKIRESRGCSLEDCVKYFTGVIGWNKDWMLMIMIDVKKSIEISIYGSSLFCQAVSAATSNKMK